MSETDFSNKLRQYIIGNKSYFSRDAKKQEQRFREHLNAENSQGTRRIVDDIIMYCEVKHGKKTRILEIGSGSGDLSVALAKYSREVSVIGLEPQLFGVEASRLRAGRYENIDATFLQGKGESLTFDEGSFDIVVMQSVIEHVADVEEVFAQARRVLKQGGSIYIEAPNYLWPYETHYRIALPFLFALPVSIGKRYVKVRGKDPVDLHTLNYVTPGSTRTHLKRPGFIMIRDLTISEYENKLSDTNRIKHRKFLKFLLSLPIISDVIRFIAITIIKTGLYPGLKFVAVK